jgi:hypothetical protein
VNEITKKLVPAVVSYIEQMGGYVTKTKLLKLLYLLDVEFYRSHRQTLTGFDWKFFHLGPWTSEFDPMIATLLASDELSERTATKQEYETKFYHASDDCDFGKLFKSAADEFPLRNVLRTWAESSTGEILDYVYFNTEPMERGIRHERLDFSSIPEGQMEKYTRPASGIPPKEIQKMRAEFQRRRTSSLPSFSFTPPRYDDEFANAIARLDQAEN